MRGGPRGRISAPTPGELRVHFEVLFFFGSVLGHLLVLTSWPLAFLRWRYQLAAQWIAVLTLPVSVIAIGITTAGALRKLRGEPTEFADIAAAPMSIGLQLVLALTGLVCASFVAWLRRRAAARRAGGMRARADAGQQRHRAECPDDLTKAWSQGSQTPSPPR